MDIMLLKVAMAHQANLDPKMIEVLVKLRKGATGSIGFKKLTTVFSLLPGWHGEKMAVLVPQVRYEKDGRVEEYGTLERMAERRLELKKLEVQALPPRPQEGHVYIMDVEEIRPLGDKGATLKYKAWVGKAGYRVTAPNGKSFDHGGKEEGYKVETWYDLQRWLYNETTFVDDISKLLGMETPGEEKERKAPKTKSDSGTCPCCFGNYKLRKHSNDNLTLVLHGYRRPGWGSVQGQCYGVGFPPFELSSAGTIHLRKLIVTWREGYEETLKKLKSGDITDIYDTHMRRMTIKDKVDPVVWQRVLSDKISDCEDKIKSLTLDHTTLTKLINNWQLQPLPEQGKSLKVWK